MAESKDDVRAQHDALGEMPGVRVVERGSLPSLNIADLLFLRRCAESCQDWEEARRLTVELSARGALTSDPVGSALAASAKAHKPDKAQARPKMHERKPPNSKLNPRAVKAMRKAYDEGERVSVLARAFGVSDRNVYSVVYGHTWKEVAP